MISEEPNNLEKQGIRERAAFNTGDVLMENIRLKQKYVNVFECPNAIRCENYFGKYIEEKSNNAVVLDCGCYRGKLTAKIIGYGARTSVGIDISDKSVALANRYVNGESSQQKALFCAGDMHHACFRNDVFDLIVGRAILHHLNFENAVAEIHRILKPGGSAVFFEALGDNLLAKLFRRLTPKARTPDEKPLSRREIVTVDKMFTQNAHRFFSLFSVPAGMITSIIKLPPENILTVTADRIDMMFARTRFKYWMRVGVLIWKK